MEDVISPLDIRKFDQSQLESWFQDQQLPAFRGRQVYQWIWQKGIASFQEMTNLSKPLRHVLEQHFYIPRLHIDLEQRSTDGTIKTRLRLHDGHLIEAVLIPVSQENRYTACISSQVGCSLTCSFCATGRMKRERNLEAGEIIDQYRIVNAQAEKAYDHPLTNIVYMGMGEPLLNYRNVMESIRILTDPELLGISSRRITVSTAGIAKMIYRLADDKVKFNLALSLHAADDQKRNEIMPINEQNNLQALMDAIDNFHQHCKGKITYEYIAFNGFNDTIKDANNLVKLCRRFPVKINIIEYNPVDDFDLKKSGRDRLSIFTEHLRKKGVQVTIRRSRGQDIDAACGQLANKN